jgi:hypothetical protein
MNPCPNAYEDWSNRSKNCRSILSRPVLASGSHLMPDHLHAFVVIDDERLKLSP